ncbi:MAG: aldo/keto reductase [Sterolibacteriaceae bacterium]|uniref:aldo/keto reductase n=1 Tax=Sulfuritalea sp. TaxID=2480090 RepID=UPI001A615532|nr:aldo/keto reductase [Sulfuritalea sp.]MBL8480214.1 aldo/keto reductase [Sterolibacteriaceae bacterium]MBN8475933.1 aldo/keto reductase [Sulfuritalea sp.]
MPARRKFLGSALALPIMAVMPSPAGAAATPATRELPGDRRPLPVIGLGTWRSFDVGADATARAGLGRLLGRFAELGGTVVDSSPMYGSAEAVLGDLAAERGLRPRLFLATKVWTQGRQAGIAQMEESLRRLRAPGIELMQVHNLTDWKQHLPTLRAWKAAGRIRYLGISHYSSGAYAEVAQVLRSEALDFLQINYSLAEQDSARRLLPLAAERGVAVIANRPFAEGALFDTVKGKPLPAAAADHGCRSWAQLFLRWILAHPAVTCTIPASTRLDHLEDNMAAGLGPLPDFREQKALARMAGF